MEQKTFKTSEVVSACTGRMLCKIDGIYQVLNFLSGESLFTHQLPRAMKELQPAFFRQYPWLEQLGDLPNVNGENWQECLKAIEDEFGTELILTKPSQTDYREMNPIDELVAMVGPEKVIPIVI